MKCKYIPLVGLVVTLVKHARAANDYQKNPTPEAYKKTWEAFIDYFTALGVSVVSTALVILAIVAASL